MPMRSLSIRPTFTRQISDQSQMEMASPLNMVPPPSVMDSFERNPVRSNTAPVVVNGRVFRIYKPIVQCAENLAQKGAELMGGVWPSPFQLTSIVALTGLTAWVIALSVKLARTHATMDELASTFALAHDAIERFYNMPYCDELPQIQRGPGLVSVRFTNGLAAPTLAA